MPESEDDHLDHLEQLVPPTSRFSSQKNPSQTGSQSTPPLFPTLNVEGVRQGDVPAQDDGEEEYDKLFEGSDELELDGQ